MHPIVSCQTARATGLLPYAIINSLAVSTDHWFPLKTAVTQYPWQVPKPPKKTATRERQKLPAQWVWKSAQLGGKTAELATLPLPTHRPLTTDYDPVAAPTQRSSSDPIAMAVLQNMTSIITKAELVYLVYSL